MKDIKVCYGVDVDCVAGWLGSYGGEDSPCDISRGVFAGRVGIPRLLDFGISIHALREEGDPRTTKQPLQPSNFYPRPPRGGRPIFILEETAMSKFLSTPSARRATRPGRCFPADYGISIHALREEGDLCGSDFVGEHSDFYPRPPRGGRQQKQRQNLYFQTNCTTFCTNLEEP